MINEQGFLDIYDYENNFDLDLLGLNELSSVRVVYNKRTQKKHFLGALLYKERPYRNSVNVGSGILKKSSYKLDSINIDRVFFLKSLIIRFLDGDVPDSTMHAILIFFEWLDLEERIEIFSDEKNVFFDIYVKYTEKLISERSHSNINKSKESKSISYAVARLRQKAAIVAIELLSERFSAHEITGWAIDLKQSSGAKDFEANINYKDFLSTRDFHIKIFNSIYDHIFSKSFDAYVVEGDERIGLKKYIVSSLQIYNIWGNNKTDYEASQTMKLIYESNGKCKYSSFEELRKSMRCKYDSGEIDKLRIDSVIRLGRKLFNSDYRSEKGEFNKFLYDVAIKSFCHVFLLDTGANPDSLAYLELVRARSLEKSGKSRLLSFKGKIKEKIELKMTARMIPMWNKMIDLHVLMHGELQGSIGIRRNDNSIVKTRWISTQKGFFEYVFPHSGTWVSAKKWRDLSSYITLSTTNDIVYSASRHNHTPETARKHYVKLDNLRAIKVNYNYFKEMANQMKLYADGKIIPVKVLKNNEGVSGKTGYCDGNVPAEIDGLTDYVKKPSCDVQLHCFFCKSYGIHANEEDILMLLSIKKWLPLQGEFVSENSDEYMVKFYPIMQRIDDILLDFKERNLSYSEIYKNAFERFENGELTDYWKAKINALHEIFSKDA